MTLTGPNGGKQEARRVGWGGVGGEMEESGVDSLGGGREEEAWDAISGRRLQLSITIDS